MEIKFKGENDLFGIFNFNYIMMAEKGWPVRKFPVVLIIYI